MADVQFKDLVQVLVNGTSASDIYALQIYDETIGDFVSRKITAGDLGACLVSQIGYTLVLETTAKTVLGAINEVNAKNGTNIKLASEGNTTIAEKIASIESAIVLVASAQTCNDGDTVDLENCVLPIYTDTNDVIHFTVPLSKPIHTGLEATLSGGFTIDGVLTDDDLETYFTVDVSITDVGLNVSLTPINAVTPTKDFIVGATSAQITFAEEES
mgnify:CR=1 FL=1